jgi:alkylation response protein AidB-like acyl-CoA dehydrogenase
MLTRTNTELPAWIRTAPLDCDDPLARARELRPLIEKDAEKGERDGQITDSVMKAIAEAGLLGIQVPKALGGTELAAHDYYDVIEELSYADGSTGWSVMAVLSATLGAARSLHPDAVAAIFQSGRGIPIGGHVSALGRAKVVDGGYIVSGNYQFGSGTRFASWILGAFAVEKNGDAVLTEDGKPKMIIGIVPREGVQLTGNWDVMGLAGTGSYDFQVLEQFMPEAFVVDIERIVGPPIGHAAWCMGVARRALDEIKALAQCKKRFGRTTTIDQQLFQYRFAQNYAAVEAARNLIRAVTPEWEKADEAGKLDLEVRARARLAQCWATRIAADAVDFAYHASGSDGLRNNGGRNVLQRCFRDIHAGTQHRQIDDNIAIDCATVLLGVASPDVRL